MARAEQAFVLAAAAAFVAGCVESGSFLPAAPTVPAPRLPMNDAYVGSVHSGRAGALSPRFSWEGSTASAKGEVRYELQYSRDVGFAAGETTTVETAETWHQVAGALEVSRVAPVGARYYWRVRACLRESCSEYTRTWWVNLGRVIKDYNGDGYSDVAVGAPGNDGVTMNGGRVFVYFGGPGQGLDGTPDVLLGSSDILDTDSRVGAAVAYAGDVNGDGFGDLLMGNPGSDLQPGRAHVYLGGVTFDPVLDLDLSNAFQTDRFGAKVVGVGDVNGDGYSDFGVLETPVNRRRLHLFLGGGGGRLTKRVAGTLEWDYFDTVAGVGDVNGDGLADFAVNYGGDAGNRGLVHLYMGGLSETFDWTPGLILRGAYDGDLFGAAIDGGDLSGDGYSDVAISNFRAAEVGINQPGRVDVFQGGGVLDDKPDVVLMGQQAKDGFGLSLDMSSDVNGDGLADLFIGARDTVEQNVTRGRGYLYLGSSALDGAPDATLSAFSNAFRAFNEVGGAGDVNGDGYDDLVSGSPTSGTGGRVDLYLGGPGNRFDATSDMILLGGMADDYFGAQLAVVESPVLRIGRQARRASVGRVATPTSRASRLKKGSRHGSP